MSIIFFMILRKWVGALTAGLAIAGFLVSVWPIKTEIINIPISTGPLTDAVIEISVPVLMRAPDPAQVSLSVDFGQTRPDPGLELFSHFEIGGLSVFPSGEFRALVNSTDQFDFQWILKPREASTFTGTIWLFAGPDRQMILAREVTLRVVKIFGLDASTIRLITISAFLLGLVLFCLKTPPRVKKTKIF